MNNRRKWILDSSSNVDVFEEEKRIVERQEEDKKMSKILSEKLRPIVENIYKSEGKMSPFKRYTSVV